MQVTVQVEDFESLQSARVKFDRAVVSAVLGQCGGKQTDAAIRLRINRATVHRILRRLVIDTNERRRLLR